VAGRLGPQILWLPLRQHVAQGALRLVFALGTTTGLGGPAEAVKAISDGRPAVVETKEQAAFLAALRAAGLTPRPVKTISGINYSNGDEMSLTLYRGEPQKVVRPATALPETAP
jgi:hypothetical protein